MGGIRMNNANKIILALIIGLIILGVTLALKTGYMNIQICADRSCQHGWKLEVGSE